ncbi:hypothetical protein TNCV_1241861 [Trichonephila clavipes]|nr:hypothetical protein TNCV_1241861 [Trichonephila clavipes]
METDSKESSFTWTVLDSEKEFKQLSTDLTCIAALHGGSSVVLGSNFEAAKGQIEELTSLKKIEEKQLEDLEALQSEREQKHALKKEHDQRVNSE